MHNKSPDRITDSPHLPRIKPSHMAFTLYFLKLGCIGFGGAISLISYMQKDLVETRRWVSKTHFLHGLTLSQLSPGPLASQLAIYLGWLNGGVLGATLVLLFFTLPSFIMITCIAMFYVHYGHLSWMHGAFYGIGASVIAIIAKGSFNLARMVIDRDPLLWAICFTNLGVTLWIKSTSILLFVLSGLLVLVIKNRFHLGKPLSCFFLSSAIPAFFLLMQNTIHQHIIPHLFFYFVGAGAFVFGSGLAIVPYLHGGVVEHYHWLTDQQFLDAVSVGMITPGPLLITVAFIGYLIAGISGALAATIGVFLPCYLIILFIAPHYSRFAHNLTLKAIVSGITAAAAGAIIGSAFILAQQAIVDLNTLMIFFFTFTIPFFIKKMPDLILVVISGFFGYLLKLSV